MLSATNVFGLDPMAFGLTAFTLSLGAIYLLFKLWMRRVQRQFVQAGDIPRAATKTSVAMMEELEQSIGGKVPKVLRNAYLDGSISQTPLPATFQHDDGEDVIAEFIAADAEANHKLTKLNGLHANSFIFASDDFGNYFVVVGGEDSVYFWAHDGDGEVSKAVVTMSDLAQLFAKRVS